MKTPGIVSVALCVVLMVGCITSLHPLYTAEDLIFSPDLVGCWSEDDSKETWEFSKEGEKEYRLVCTGKDGKTGTFVVHLLKIKGKMFLDLFPSEPDWKETAFYQLHLLPVHSFIYVKQVKPTLQMSMPDGGWLEKLIEGSPGAIRHEKIEDRIVLTASTKELQAFFLKHLATEDAFGELCDMKRRQVTAEQPKKANAGGGQ